MRGVKGSFTSGISRSLSLIIITKVGGLNQKRTSPFHRAKMVLQSDFGMGFNIVLRLQPG